MKSKDETIADYKNRLRKAALYYRRRAKLYLHKENTVERGEGDLIGD